VDGVSNLTAAQLSGSTGNNYGARAQGTTVVMRDMTTLAWRTSAVPTGVFNALAPVTPNSAAPSLVSMLPGAGTVSASASFTLQFNVPVQAGAGSITFHPATGPDVVVNIGSGSEVVFNGETVTIDLASNLSETGLYTVTISDGAITSATGESYSAGMNSVASFSATSGTPVTSGVSTAPVWLNQSSLDGAADVATNGVFVLSFNEAIAAGSGSIVFNPVIGSSISISVTDASQVSIAGNTVTINPTALLDPSVKYTVSIGIGVLTDPLGNVFDAIADAGWNFTTAAIPEPPAAAALVGACALALSVAVAPEPRRKRAADHPRPRSAANAAATSRHFVSMNPTTRRAHACPRSTRRSGPPP
jgi:hypothetical protein